MRERLNAGSGNISVMFKIAFDAEVRRRIAAITPTDRVVVEQRVDIGRFIV